MSTTEFPISTALTREVFDALAAPFALDLVEVKPGATTKDKTAALALAYVDWRAYARRLDEVVGPCNWSFKLVPWGPTRIVAELTIFGITKSATGEGPAQDENCGTIAEAQAKKRACAEFGLGRYLYDLPNNCWFDYNAEKKQFVNPRQAVISLYRAAHLLPSGQAERSSQATADPDRVSRAQATLAQAEQQAGLRPAGLRPAAVLTRESGKATPATAEAATSAQIRALMQLQQQAEAASMAKQVYGADRFKQLTRDQADDVLSHFAS